MASKDARSHYIHFFRDFIERGMSRWRGRLFISRIAGTDLDGVQEEGDIHFLVGNLCGDGGDAISQSGDVGWTGGIFVSSEDGVELLEGELAVLDDGLELAGVDGGVGLVEDRLGIGSLSAQMAEGNVHLADSDSGIIKGWRGYLFGAQIEGSGKGIDGVDVKGRRAAVHGGQLSFPWWAGILFFSAVNVTFCRTDSLRTACDGRAKPLLGSALARGLSAQAERWWMTCKCWLVSYGLLVREAYLLSLGVPVKKRKSSCQGPN